MKQLPPITNRQQDILELIYLFRFLDRIQIQSFLGHKDKQNITMWLKDLRDKDYPDWIYSNAIPIASNETACRAS
jgi:hypothetical protein